MMMVLSGMSSMEQMKDNLSYMKDFQPLNETELEAVKKVQSIFRGMNLIPCTACRYCTDGCPRQIAIPDLFAVMNTKQIHHAGTPTFTIIMSIPAQAAGHLTASSAAGAKRPALSTYPSANC